MARPIVATGRVGSRLSSIMPHSPRTRRQLLQSLCRPPAAPRRADGTTQNRLICIYKTPTLLTTPAYCIPEGARYNRSCRGPAYGRGRAPDRGPAASMQGVPEHGDGLWEGQIPVVSPDSRRRAPLQPVGAARPLADLPHRGRPAPTDVAPRVSASRLPKMGASAPIRRWISGKRNRASICRPTSKTCASCLTCRQCESSFSILDGNIARCKSCADPGAAFAVCHHRQHDVACEDLAMEAN